MKAIGAGQGTSVNVAATASSVGATIDMGGMSTLYIANTSTTVNVSVRAGVGAQTAVLNTDIRIPPMGQLILDVSPAITHVAAIGSAAGPTQVSFTPCRQLA